MALRASRRLVIEGFGIIWGLVFGVIFRFKFVFRVIYGFAFPVPLVPLTNSRRHVNENSQGQDYSDDLTESPFVFSQLDDRAIVIDLESP